MTSVVFGRHTGTHTPWYRYVIWECTAQKNNCDVSSADFSETWALSLLKTIGYSRKQTLKTSA